jgi:hypothetical protein
MTALELSRGNDPFLNVKLGRNDLRVLDLLSQVICMDVLLTFFVSVHGEQLELFLSDREVNQVNDLFQISIGNETRFLAENLENVQKV